MSMGEGCSAVEAFLHILRRLGNATAEAATAFLFSEPGVEEGFKDEEREGEGEVLDPTTTPPAPDSAEVKEEKDPDAMAAGKEQEAEAEAIDTALTQELGGGIALSSQPTGEGYQHSR